MCRVSTELENKTLLHSRKLKILKTLLNFRKINNLDVEVPRNFPKTKRVLSIVRAAEAGQQI